MPKIKVDYLLNQRDRYAMHTDCKELIEKTSKLTQDYWDVLSFADKQQLLYIVRVIEKNNQRLPEYRYKGYKYKLNNMLTQYAKKYRNHLCGVNNLTNGR